MDGMLHLACQMLQLTYSTLALLCGHIEHQMSPKSYGNMNVADSMQDLCPHSADMQTRAIVPPESSSQATTRSIMALHERLPEMRYSNVT